MKAKEDDADMVICDYYINTKDRETNVKQKPLSLHHESVLKELFTRLHGSCWNKLIKRDLFNQVFCTLPFRIVVL